MLMECMHKIINLCMRDWTRGRFEIQSAFKMLIVSSDKNKKKKKSAVLLIVQYIYYANQ